MVRGDGMMGLLSLAVCAGLAILIALVAFYFFGAFERGLDKGLGRFNRTLTRPVQKARNVQVSGRDHVCEFGPGSIFCSKCGKTE